MNKNDVMLMNNIINGFFPELVTDLEESFKKVNSKIPKSNSGYPITDIWHKEGVYGLDMAVTGFTPSEVKKGITYDNKNNILSIEIKSEEKEKDNDKHYFQRKISKRSIKESYQFAKEMELEKIDVKIENGLLNIQLIEKEKPKTEVPVNFIENKKEVNEKNENEKEENNNLNQLIEDIED